MSFITITSSKNSLETDQNDFLQTHCLAYSIYTGNLNEAIYQDKHLFDFSGYEKATPYLNVENKKGTGKMKDGMGGIRTREFVGKDVIVK